MPSLYEAFRSQSWPDLELLVGDDSPLPSPFFAALNDPRVRYWHWPARQTIGDKRNHLCAAATGEVIAFFDDDDHYAPDYIRRMVDGLGDADLVKLAGWYVYAVEAGELYYWDTARTMPVHHRLGGGPPGFALAEQFPPDFTARNVDGYGFSYVFRRDLLARAAFPARNFGEDLAFVTAARQAGARVKAVQDDSAVVAHLVHASSTSTAFPQYWIPPVATPRLFPDLAGFLRAVASFSR